MCVFVLGALVVFLLGANGAEDAAPDDLNIRPSKENYMHFHHHHHHHPDFHYHFDDDEADEEMPGTKSDGSNGTLQVKMLRNKYC